ncbi:uncharacterized protein V1516DRAFT_683058 [Lipomyces oligophaga]|uniref:uncharacterized protein n=1 Tax=Lipomyces oligophaga TaxID=45792 RepID=UPI0034CEFDA6
MLVRNSVWLFLPVMARLVAAASTKTPDDFPKCDWNCALNAMHDIECEGGTSECYCTGEFATGFGYCEGYYCMNGASDEEGAGTALSSIISYLCSDPDGDFLEESYTSLADPLLYAATSASQATISSSTSTSSSSSTSSSLYESSSVQSVSSVASPSISSTAGVSRVSSVSIVSSVSSLRSTLSLSTAMISEVSSSIESAIETSTAVPSSSSAGANQLVSVASAPLFAFIASLFF